MEGSTVGVWSKMFWQRAYEKLSPWVFLFPLERNTGNVVPQSVLKRLELEVHTLTGLR